MNPPAWKVRAWGLLLRVRPAQLGDWVKRLLGIRRIEIQDRSGNRFWVDPVSVFGMKLLTQGCHEASLTRIVQKLLRDGDTYLDVGANEGYFCVLAARRGASVLAVEPQSRLQAILRRNLDLNGCRAVRVVQAALSDRAGSADLYLRPSSNTGASSFFPHWRLGRVVERVPCKTLDELLREQGAGKIRLMKVDCEGAEHLVLAGAAETLARHQVDYLALEYHRSILGQVQMLATDSALREAGYRLSTCLGVTIYHRPGAEVALQEIGKTLVEHALAGA